jgi:LysM repeat protein
LKKIIVLLILSIVSYQGFSQSVINNYVDENKELAVDLMNQHHVPASIILAVAIHESAAGTSKIARYLNNHFGIKGHNSNTQIRSSYKDYDGPKDSYLDFVDKLQTRSKFKILFDKYSQYEYKQWAYGIQRGGYAASKTWAAQVIAIIKKYQLYNYDNRPDDYVETVLPAATVVKTTVKKTYTVKGGDTLGVIARKFGTSVKNLMQKNNLKSTVLQIGQKLKI